jgi:hypothetical protein
MRKRALNAGSEGQTNRSIGVGESKVQRPLYLCSANANSEMPAILSGRS